MGGESYSQDQSRCIDLSRYDAGVLVATKREVCLKRYYSHPRILSFYGIASKGQGMVAKLEGVLAVAR